MIRTATKADVPAILGIYAPYILNTTYTFEYTVPSETEFAARFDAITKQFPWLVWEEDGVVLGYAYGSAPFERAAYGWCSEISVYLAPEIHGKGIGKLLCAAVEEIMWQQGYRVIYSLITTENEGSLRFHEKLGYTFACTMERCGIKFGRWLGIVWMEKRRNSVETPSVFPVSWTEIVKNDGNLRNILANLPLSKS